MVVQANEQQDEDQNIQEFRVLGNNLTREWTLERLSPGQVQRSASPQFNELEPPPHCQIQRSGPS